MANLYRVTGTPTTVIVGPRQDLLERLAGPMTEEGLIGKVQHHVCAGLARPAHDAVARARTQRPKQAAHWRQELEAADRKCRAGHDAQARAMYSHIAEEVKRETTKR